MKTIRNVYALTFGLDADLFNIDKFCPALNIWNQEFHTCYSAPIV